MEEVKNGNLTEITKWLNEKVHVHGAIYTPEHTTFRVWSPISSSMKVRIYNTSRTRVRQVFCRAH